VAHSHTVRGFVLGLVIGLVAGGGGAWLYLRERPHAAVVIAAKAGPDAGVAGKKRKRGPRTGGAAAADDDGDQPAPVLGPSDLRMTAEGDSLSRGPQDLDLGAGDTTRELTTAEINGAMSEQSDAIGECIVDATGAAEVNGRINAGVVVSPDGRVTQTRVEGPAWLMRHGLGSCVRARLRSLHFPATGKESVVKYPFTVS
jgi:hypothetical protein